MAFLEAQRACALARLSILATRMLIDWLHGQAPECMLCKVPTRLVVRESCQALAPY